MPRHDEAADGRFCYRAGDWVEVWSCRVFFDTRDEAIEDARREYGVGIPISVGVCRSLSADEAGDAFVRDYDDANETLGIQDEWSWCEDALLDDPGEEAIEELREFARKWAAKWKVASDIWRVEEVTT